MPTAGFNTRNLYLFAFFFVVLTGLAWINYYFVKDVDKAYTSLLNESATRGNALSAGISATVFVIGESYRCLNADTPNLENRLYRAISSVNERLAKFPVKYRLEPTQRLKFEQLLKLGNTCRVQTQQFTGMLEDNRRNEAKDFLNGQLAVNLRNYVQKQISWMNEDRNSALNASTEISRTSERISGMNMALVWVPVGLLVAMIIISVLYISYLIYKLNKY